MSWGLRMPDYPTPGRPARAEWGVAVVDQIRRLSGHAPRLYRPKLRSAAPELALTWSIEGTLATLSPGLMLMRGELYTVNGGSITISDSPFYAWLQFTITPGIAPAPEIQVGTSWSPIDLGIHGRYPLAQFTSEMQEGVRVVTHLLLYHPGGTIAYPLD